MTDEEKKDILFQIDMQLYDEFNGKFCEMNDNLGTIYSYKDIEDLEKLEKETKIKLLREAIKKQQKEIETLKLIHESYKEMIKENNYISKDKIKAKIEEIKNECKYCDFTGEVCQELLQNNNCTQGNTIKVLHSLLEKE